MQIIYTDKDQTTKGNHTTALVAFPTNGSLMQFDSNERNGIAYVTPVEVVQQASESGGYVVASSLSTMTGKGTILTGSGTANYILAAGTKDQLLKADPAQPGGVYWGDPSTVTGTVPPTPSTIVQRDTDGSIRGAGYLTSGNIVMDTVTYPTSNTQYNIGTSTLPFANIWGTTGIFTTVNAATLTNPGAANLSITSSSSYAVSINSALTVSTNAVTSVQDFTAQSGTLNVGPTATTGSWRLVISVANSTLEVQYYDGAAWVTKGTFNA